MKLSLNHLKVNYLILGLILLMAAFTRFYRLGDVPHGFYWDEAAITYNAWGIAVWNRDEYAIKLPISFKSFGDYKAPLLIYILGSIFKITGLHPEYLRWLIAFFGTINVFLVWLIARRLKPKPWFYAHFAAFSLGIMPWAIHFSRFGSEATLALTLILLVTLFGLKSKENRLFLYPGAFCLASSIYAYHSVKLFLPVFGLLLILSFRKHFLPMLTRHHLLALSLFIVICLPFLHDSLVGSGFERGKSLIIFSGGHLAPLMHTLTLFKENLLSYLTLDFWLFGRDIVGLRHGVPGYGVVYGSIFILFILGLGHQFIKPSPQGKFLLLWFISALAPAILSEGNPHAIRSLLVQPVIAWIGAEGLIWLWQSIKFQPLRYVFMSLIIGFSLFEFSRYQAVYYGSYAIQSAIAFQYGYQEAILAAQKFGKTTQTFVVTTAYGQPYIYTLLYRAITPAEFLAGALVNYEFHPISWPENKPNRLYIATPAEIPPGDPHVFKTITIPGSSEIVFVLAKT